MPGRIGPSCGVGKKAKPHREPKSEALGRKTSDHPAENLKGLDLGQAPPADFPGSGRQWRS